MGSARLVIENINVGMAIRIAVKFVMCFILDKGQTIDWRWRDIARKKLGEPGLMVLGLRRISI
jgi:hypothetical protein